MAGAKSLNGDLGALGSGQLEADLPGIRAALDPGSMHARLQNALLADRPGSLAECRLVSAILVPGDSATVRYELDVAAGPQTTDTVLVTGRVFPDLGRAASYAAGKLSPLVDGVRSRTELAPLDAPVGLLPELAMVLYAYPLDGDLPTLGPATDPALAGPVLAELLAANGRPAAGVTACRAEPAHYNRRHRCMLRYHLDLDNGETLRLYGKVANDGSTARSPQVVTALRPLLAAGGVAVPDCLGFRPDLELAVFSEIAGSPVVAQLLKARLRGEPAPDGLTLESAVQSCAQIAARLHTSDLRLGAARPLSLELTRLRADLVPMRRLAPELAQQLADALDTVERRADGAPGPALRQCHGDFSYTQLVFDGTRPGLVDFDGFCLAEPALDLGQFLVYLRYAATKAQVGPDESSALTEMLAGLFTAAYVGAGGPPAAMARVGLYEVTNLVRMAQHAWHNLKSRRLQSVVSLLQARLDP